MDSEAFVPLCLELIRGAEASIELEMFIFRNRELVQSLLGRRIPNVDLRTSTLAEALGERARAGVRIHLMLNPFPSMLEPKLLRSLRRSGIEVAFYPIHELSGAIYKIDHVKLLIVDGKSAMTGGSNWGAHPAEYHDYNLRLDGPVVGQIRTLFATSWNLANGLAPPALPSAPKGPLEVLVTSPGREEAFEAVVESIEQAGATIRVEQFLLREKRIVAALIAAQRRRVNVRVLLDPNVIYLGLVNLPAKRALLEAGVPVRLFRDPEKRQLIMHSKLAVFDDETVILGSANWTDNALHVNHELVIRVREPSIARAFAEAFDADWEGRSMPDQGSHALRETLEGFLKVLGAKLKP